MWFLKMYSETTAQSSRDGQGGRTRGRVGARSSASGGVGGSRAVFKDHPPKGRPGRTARGKSFRPRPLVGIGSWRGPAQGRRGRRRRSFSPNVNNNQPSARHRAAHAPHRGAVTARDQDDRRCRDLTTIAQTTDGSLEQKPPSTTPHIIYRHGVSTAHVNTRTNSVGRIARITFFKYATRVSSIVMRFVYITHACLCALPGVTRPAVVA